MKETVTQLLSLKFFFGLFAMRTSMYYLDRGLRIGQAEYVATGHYAQLARDGVALVPVVPVAPVVRRRPTRLAMFGDISPTRHPPAVCGVSSAAMISGVNVFRISVTGAKAEMMMLRWKLLQPSRNGVLSNPIEHRKEFQCFHEPDRLAFVASTVAFERAAAAEWMK